MKRFQATTQHKCFVALLLATLLQMHSICSYEVGKKKPKTIYCVNPIVTRFLLPNMFVRPLLLAFILNLLRFSTAQTCGGTFQTSASHFDGFGMSTTFNFTSACTQRVCRLQSETGTHPWSMSSGGMPVG